jgi:hypothetical protein
MFGLLTEFVIAAWLARFAWLVAANAPEPGIVLCLLAAGLFGDVSCRPPIGAFRLVGGIGKGLAPPAVVTELTLLTGEFTAA